MKKNAPSYLPAQDATDAYWEVAASTGADIPDVWAVWLQISATGAGESHGSLLNLENANYALVIFCGVSPGFSHGPYSLKAVNRHRIVACYYWDYGYWSALCHYCHIVDRHSYPGISYACSISHG